MPFYANIHKSVHKLLESPLFPPVFALLCLGCAASVLAVSGALLLAAESGFADYHTARRLAPMLADAASVTAVIAVGGGAFLERLRLDKSR